MAAAPTPDIASLLMVEDEAIIALAQRKSLQKAGYRVRVVHTGESAVTAVEEDPRIDLILMDIDLGGGIDGPEAARRILELRELPIVFLTSHSDQSYVDRVEAVTKYGYVLKSSGAFVLLQAIKTALQLFSAHMKLHRSEARFRTLFENTPTVSIQGYSPDGTVRFWNRASEALYGYTADEAMGKNLLDLIVPDSMRREVSEAVRSSVQTGEPIPADELELKRKGGGTVYVFSSHALLPYPDGSTEVFCLDVDISERKEMERALRRQEEEYRTLIEQQSELFVRVGADGTFEFVSDSYCLMFGKGRNELIGHSFMPLVHEEDREQTARAMESLYAPPYRCRLEQRAWTVDGWRWLEWDDTAIVNDDGEVAAILGAGRDITDRKEAEEERRRILNTLPIPVVISEGPEEQVIIVNDAFTELFGYTSADIPDAAHWFELAYPDPEYRHEVSREWKEHIAEAERTSGPMHPMTVNAAASDGSVHTVVVRTHLLGGKKLVTFTDLTDLNAVQQRLERSVAEKDRLMLELNHRVKNNLTLVSSLVGMKEAELNETVDLSDIRGQIDAIGLIHEKLYSTGNTRQVDLRAYVDDLLPSVFSFYPRETVTIVNTLADVQLPTGLAVPIGVLINELAMNAIKHGFDPSVPPRFTVDSDIVESEPIETSNAGKVRTMVLTVSNNGRAFPPEVDIDAPSSLGLRLISALAEQLSGGIELSRTPETTFRITIPIEPI